MHDRPIRGFASDNCSGADPSALAALARVNEGHQGAYGDDTETARFRELVCAGFGKNAVGFPMLNGTGANVAALRAIARPHQAVICAATAHIAIDEAAAPEAIAGVKLLTVHTPDGKLTPQLAATRLIDPADLPHHARPMVVSIAQATEAGTVYSPREVAALAAFAHEHGMLLHVDGARLANAAQHENTGLADLTLAAGADVLTLGANKNGAAFGEAVIFADRELAAGFEVLRKGTLQLASKMRFLSAQLNAQLENEHWREPAGHSNGIARTLADRLARLDEVEIEQAAQANIVFVSLPAAAGRHLTDMLAPHRPLLFDAGDRVVMRLVASWDSRIEDVEHLLACLDAALSSG